jgi:hypothetical protein
MIFLHSLIFEPSPVHIDKAGVIVVVPSKPEERLTTEAVSNEWDDVVA